MQAKIGFSLQSQYDHPITHIIDLLRDFGFTAVSPLWTPDLDMDKLASYVYGHGMLLQSLHAPHKGISTLWEPDIPASMEAQKNILCSIDTCYQYKIPLLVVHGWQGLSYTFPDTPLNYRFFDKMVDYAQQRGVSIAFENLEGEEYLDALMERYRDQSNVGFCWDSGHDHCYPHKQDYLQHYGNRLIMTHLNDNFGVRDSSGIHTTKDDLHFLPYDGNLDWDYTIRRLKNAPPQQILNFEFKTRSHSTNPKDLPYSHLSMEEFIKQAADRAHKVVNLYHSMIE